jgi:hypothetical protein
MALHRLQLLLVLVGADCGGDAGDDPALRAPTSASRPPSPAPTPTAGRSWRRGAASVGSTTNAPQRASVRWR